jgi:DNA polymerase
LYCTAKGLKNQGKTKMSNNALRDLVLSGVYWELADNSSFVSSSPQERFAETAQNQAMHRAAASVVPPVSPTATISLDTVRSMASRPTDIDALNRMIGEFNHPLRGGATTTVLPHVGRGKLLILTDMPSSDDDASGVVLSGTAGELMDKMLAAIGLTREDVSIVPVLFWRTPGGRTPSREELDLSRPFVDKVIELLAPRVILTLGTLPAAELAGINLAKSHGAQTDGPFDTTLVPIFHPNYLLLKPTAKRDVWTALQNVQNILKNAE